MCLVLSMTGFYGVTSLTQVGKLMKPLYKYSMAEFINKEGFNAGEIQSYCSNYLFKNCVGLLNQAHEAKAFKYNKEGLIGIGEYLAVPKFWNKMAIDVCKHYNVDLIDMQDVIKGVALIAWFMAQDWKDILDENEANVKEFGYNQYMAMSYAFWKMANATKNGREKLYHDRLKP